MKNALVLILLFCMFKISTAQVGIGTVTPDGSSILDVASTEKGLLIPRMTLGQRNLIGSPATGLLIYQTTNTPGFYFYNGSVWVNLSASANSWNILGNSGTNPSSNFLGTTDAQDIAFRSNNIEKMRLTQLGQLSFTNASNSIFIGTEAGENDNQTDNTNIGLGYRALFNNSNGYDNIAIGRLSLTNNTTGRDNTAIGEEALISNLTGFDNIALGDKLLTALTSGDNNIAIGDRTLIATNGSYNLAIGSSAGSVNTGSGSIFLGYFAGASEIGSNKLYIENSNADANNALIYGEFDTNTLRTNGQFQIGNPATSGYALPTNRGTANQVLTSAGDGTTSWQSGSGGAQEINDLTDAKTVSRSVYLGNGSGNNDNSGDKQNTAVGDDALRNTNSGIQNVAIGESTMLNNTSGERNTAVGQSSMRNNSSGNRNTVIGEDALYSNSSGSGNVAIGNRAGYGETSSNKLYIENSDANANNALIYGEFDTNIVRTNGELQIGNPTGTGYALPTNQGTANQVLTTAGDGTTSWGDVTVVEVDGDVTNEIQDLSVVGNEIQISGGGASASLRAFMNPKFPDGMAGAQPVTHRFPSSYTVPAGKNFYITQIYSVNPAASFLVNGIVMKFGMENRSAAQGLANPIICGSGDVITTAGTMGTSVRMNGLLVDAGVTPVTGNTDNYTVPAGKMFVLFGVSNDAANLISISRLTAGVTETLYQGQGNNNTSTYSIHWAFQNPMFFDENEVLQILGTGTEGFNGYLIDK
ncbi:hypothetical protein G5B37_08725 [Rasiella rasia]|uniref:Uncharacterized protein n=1 Tax=Rasiella rasia TaxID=2744027 RepID=A0A6G6GM94_9FLAO|nr:hypothetical protein [Rasiella rasia]QIE59644.1 hypothetical protein G5B37_08725 [Rasiella rasia]